MKQYKIPLADFSEHLKTLTQDNWARLFNLLNEMEKPQEFGQIKGIKKLEDDTLSMPYWDWSKIVSKFIKTIHELNIMIEFDWGSWEEGKKILRNNNQDFSKLDILTLCKLITSIIRADRFMDGTLASRFEDETIQKIVRGLEIRVNSF